MTGTLGKHGHLALSTRGRGPVTLASSWAVGQIEAGQQVKCGCFLFCDPPKKKKCQDSETAK